MKLFSLFSGIGGLDYGLKKAQLVGFSEIKKESVEIYKKHFVGKNFGDITRINYKELPDFDILTGGFPCQSFSLAGLRKGFGDDRGKMIFRIYDLLKEKKPQYLVLENVKGLLNHNSGKTYKDVVKLLNDASYFVRVVLLNSLYYGTAQNRERVIFLGSKEDFNVKVEKRDESKRFRDIREREVKYNFIKDTKRNRDKIEQKLLFNFELIGGYDRVGTLTTQYGCGEKLVYEEDLGYRYLTVLECERLQGFPDNWTVGTSDNARYWALGNAVNCKMSEYIFNDLLKGVWKL